MNGTSFLYRKQKCTCSLSATPDCDGACFLELSIKKRLEIKNLGDKIKEETQRGITMPYMPDKIL